MSESIEQPEPLPVLELLRPPSRRQITGFALGEMRDDWHQPAEITDGIDVSGETLRKQADVLVEFGVLDLKSQDAQIPHYRLADSPVVSLLDSWNGHELYDLFKGKNRDKKQGNGPRKLVEFFLTQADPDESYSYNRVDEESGINYRTVSGHMSTLVDAGLVVEVEGKQDTEYQLDADSAIYEFLFELNEKIYHEYQERR